MAVVTSALMRSAICTCPPVYGGPRRARTGLSGAAGAARSRRSRRSAGRRRRHGGERAARAVVVLRGAPAPPSPWASAWGSGRESAVGVSPAPRPRCRARSGTGPRPAAADRSGRCRSREREVVDPGTFPRPERARVLLGGRLRACDVERRVRRRRGSCRGCRIRCLTRIGMRVGEWRFARDVAQPKRLEVLDRRYRRWRSREAAAPPRARTP